MRFELAGPLKKSSLLVGHWAGRVVGTATGLTLAHTIDWGWAAVAVMTWATV
jgi:hypothetical protein